MSRARSKQFGRGGADAMEHSAVREDGVHRGENGDDLGGVEGISVGELALVRGKRMNATGVQRTPRNPLVQY